MRKKKDYIERKKKIKKLQDFYFWLWHVEQKLKRHEKIDVSNINERITEFFQEERPLFDNADIKQQQLSGAAMNIASVLSVFGTVSGMMCTIISIAAQFLLVAESIVFLWGIPVVIATGYGFYLSRSKVNEEKEAMLELGIAEIKFNVTKAWLKQLELEHQDLRHDYLQELSHCLHLLAPMKSLNPAANHNIAFIRRENHLLVQLELILRQNPVLTLPLETLLQYPRKALSSASDRTQKPKKLDIKLKLSKWKSAIFGFSTGASVFGLTISTITAVKITAAVAVLAISGPYGWCILAGAALLGVAVGIGLGILHYFRQHKIKRKKLKAHKKTLETQQLYRSVKEREKEILKLHQKKDAAVILRKHIEADFIATCGSIELRSQTVIDSITCTLDLYHTLKVEEDNQNIIASLITRFRSHQESLKHLLELIDIQKDRLQKLSLPLMQRNKRVFEKNIQRYAVLRRKLLSQVEAIDLLLANYKLAITHEIDVKAIKPGIFIKHTDYVDQRSIRDVQDQMQTQVIPSDASKEASF